MKRKSLTIVIVALISVMILTVAGAAFASPDVPDATPSTTEVGKYLVIGMRQTGSDAFNISSSNELGADRSFLSGADPNTYDVFAERWHLGGANVNYDNKPPTEEPDTFQQSQSHETPDPAAPVFQGIDWSGNVALTHSSGRFAMQDIQVFADLGVQAVNANPVQSVQNSDYFPLNQTTANDGATPGNESDGDLDDPGAPGTDSGIYNNDGLEGGVDLSQLSTDLGLWRTYIQGLTGTDSGQPSHCTITSDIEEWNSKPGGNPGPYVVNYDDCDTNDDGVAVIDINRGGSDFKVNNSDWILQGDGSVLFMFRIRGESNMLVDNSSILLGDGGIGGGSTTTPVDKLGAIFVKAFPDEEGIGSSNQVIKGSNVILNGIGWWDLTDINNENSNDTVVNVENGQGCAQFISNQVTFNNVRWNRCALGSPAAVQDWGDLPDSFDTTNTQSGPNHVIGSDLYLGSCVDAEGNGQPDDTPNPQAGAGGAGTGDGDDGNTGTSAIGTCDQDGDDEDGVTLVTPLVPGAKACVEIDAGNTGTTATLYGWIDFNGDGDFDGDANEYLTFTSGGTVANGGATDQQACFNVPSGATFDGGETHMRFRLTRDTLTSTDWGGAADDGEVEDYWQQLACVGNYVWDDSNGSTDYVQDGVDANLPGVEVRLVWADGNGTIDTDASDATAQGDDLIYTTTTDSNGRYDFCGLVSGTYRAEVPTAPSSAMQAVKPDIGGDDELDSDGVQSSVGGPVDGPDFTIPHPPTTLPTDESGNQDNPGGLNVPDAQDDLTYDFGYCEGSTIKAMVCLDDITKDGSCEPGEAPFKNIIVALIPQGATPGNTLIKTTDTNGLVEWEQFQAGFTVPGDYMIQVQENYLNAQTLFTPTTSWYSFHIDVCESVEAEFGYAPTELGVVGDLVWYDSDSEGDQDEWWDANNDGLITQNFPDANGSINFDDLEWFDINENGTYDLPEDEGELRKCGIDNVTVTLDYPDPPDTRITDLFGYYRFTDLPLDGAYTTDISPDDPELQAGRLEIYNSGLCKTQSTLLATSASSPTASLALQQDVICGLTTNNTRTSKELLPPPPSSNNIDLTLDYATSCTESADRVAIGNIVWADDGNGNDAFKNDAMQNNGEPGIDGATVELYRDVDGDGVCEPGGDDGAALATTITTGGGSYQFLYLDPSTGGDPTTNYCVAVVTSSVSVFGFTQSSTGGGHNPDMPGDQDVADGDDGVPSAAHVISQPFPATVNGQTTPDSDDPAGYADESAYMTVDFGFFSGGSTAVNLKAFGVEQSLPAGLLVLAAALLLTALYFVRRRTTNAG